MTRRLKAAVLGAGSWGTTIAGVLAENGSAVTLWCYLPTEYELLTATRERGDILPGYKLPPSVSFTTDAREAVGSAELVIFACPSVGMRELARVVKGAYTGKPVVASAAKGLEEETGLRMTQILAEEAAGDAGAIVAFSGPSHAEEVSRKIPTSIVVASDDGKGAELLRDAVMTPYLRVYTNDDVAGTEYGGAFKNIIAVAVGVVDGLGYGDNTKAALMTRGLAEITRLGVRLGARAQTFAGLTGLGDLITTCISRHSRNRHVGEELGRGRKLDDVLASMSMVAEGVRTTRVAYRLSREAGVEMPITEEMYGVLFAGKDARDGLRSLMARKPKNELD